MPSPAAWASRIWRCVTMIRWTGYQDIVENGVPTLDFVSSAQLNKYVTLSLKAKNLLNPAHQLTRKGNADGKEVVLSKYKRGMDFSIGVTCNF